MKKTFYINIFFIPLLLLVLGVSCSKKGNENRRVKVVAKEKTSNYFNESRVALVVGNSNYELKPLKNPLNDARDMASVLKEKGFDVTKINNADRTQMINAIRDFGNNLKKGGVGLFYFSGHGVQVEGLNYLIPIGANIQEEHEVPLEGVSLNRVLGFMESAENRLNLVILDACRDNPFKYSFKKGISGGLAHIDAPSGTLIAFSTGPGKTAADGKGRNGIYSKHLLTYIGSSSLEIGHMLREVRSKVRQETNGRQIPWEATSLEGSFYFSPENLPSSIKDSSLEITFWRSIEKSHNPEDFKAYLEKFPEGTFVKLANLRIESLEEINIHLNRLNNINRKINFIKALKSKQNSTVRMIDEISNALPNNVWLVQIRCEGKKIFLKGKAISNDLTADFINNLKDSGFFKNIEILGLQRRKINSTDIFYFKFSLFYKVEASDINEIDEPRNGQSLGNIKAEIKTRSNILANLENLLIEEKELTGFMKRVESLISASKLRIMKIQQPIKKREEYHEFQVSFHLIGNYHNLGTFFDQMPNLRKITIIGELNILPEEKPTKKFSINANFRIKLYGVHKRSNINSVIINDALPINQSHKFEYKPNRRRDPFWKLISGEINRNQLSGINGFKIEELVLEAIMKLNQGGYKAFVKGPDGRPYELKVGQNLYDGQIIKIDPDSITFKKILPGQKVEIIVKGFDWERKTNED